DASWLLESTPVLGVGANWQPVSGLPTRSIFGLLQGVNVQLTNAFFRLHQP
ncbi:MAG: hypothetical protein RL380_1073, partial [Verrucomicrobiota bacterium]